MAHLAHAVRPEVLPNQPLGQLPQELLAFAATRTEKVPTAHEIHAPASLAPRAPEYVPGVQGSQVLLSFAATATEYLPTPQAMQAELELAAVSGE